LVVLVELDEEPDEELDDEQPAASSAAAATPTANLYDDLTSASCKSFPVPEVDCGCPERARAAVPKRFADPPLPQLRAQDKRT
jgi:hypothetical protein